MRMGWSGELTRLDSRVCEKSGYGMYIPILDTHEFSCSMYYSFVMPVTPLFSLKSLLDEFLCLFCFDFHIASVLGFLLL